MTKTSATPMCIRPQIRVRRNLENVNDEKIQVKARPIRARPVRNSPIASTSREPSPSTSTHEATELILMSHQVAHYGTLSQVLEYQVSVIDYSQTGGGKTFVAMKTALDRNLRVVIICPASTQSMWKELTTEYGVSVEAIMSYASFRGRSNKLNHPYLIRSGGKKDPVFHPSSKTKKLIDGDGIDNEGILVIYDEAQNMKNLKTATVKAAHGLSNGIAYAFKSRLSTKSRIMLLSASPFDKEEHAYSLMAGMGLTDSLSISTYDPATGQHDLNGFSQIYDKCRELNEDVTVTVAGSVTSSTKIKQIRIICYELFINVIGPFMGSGIECERQGIYRDKFFGMNNDDDKTTMDEGMNILKKSVNINGQEGTVVQGSLGAITTALKTMETAKLNIIIRAARKVLDENENNKVLIFVNYISSFDKIKDELYDYGAEILFGKTKIADRTEIVDKYQEQNNDLRVIISNTQVGGVGLSLDDQDGEFPRYVFVVPTYNFITLYQACGRVDRSKTKSVPHIKFIYSKEHELEKKILLSLAKKSDVLRSLTKSTEEYPGDFEQEYE